MDHPANQAVQLNFINMQNFYLQIIFYALILNLSSGCATHKIPENFNPRNAKYETFNSEKKLPTYDFGITFLSLINRDLALLERLRSKKNNAKEVKLVEIYLILDIADYWYFGFPPNEKSKEDRCAAIEVFENLNYYLEKYHPEGIDLSGISPTLADNFRLALTETKLLENDCQN